MAKKQKQIIWTKQSERRLEKAVKDFNKRVQSLKRTRKDKSFLPSEISFIGTRRKIKTQRELERVVKNLSEFKGSKAYKKVKLKSGKELTAWEKKQIQKQKAVAVRRLNKQLKEYKRPEYRMGTPDYQRAKSALEKIKHIEKLKGKAFEKALTKLEDYASADFEMRRAVLYRKNYMTMLRKEYRNYENYLKLVRRLNKIENPLDFYEFIKNSSYGGKVEDILFMYDTTDGEEILENLFEEIKEAGV